MSRLSSLQVLVLSNNRIKKLSEDFVCLRQLKMLRLDGNCLSSVQHLQSCASLVYLDCSRNRLQGPCSAGLESLTALEYLNLSDNRFEEIGSLKDMKHLEELNIAGNQISSFHGLVGLPALTVRSMNRRSIVEKVIETSKMKSLADHGRLFARGKIK